MKPTIYVAHSTKIDYDNEVYKPIKETLGETCHLILPHESGKKPEYSLPIIQNSEAVIAFIDGISEARAVEIGFAIALRRNLAFVHNKNTALVSSAYSFFPQGTATWIEYSTEKELAEQLVAFIDLIKQH